MAMGEYAPVDFMTAEDEAAAPNPLAEKLSRQNFKFLKDCQKANPIEIARDLDLQEPTIKLP